jgi:hypothetical protein
VNYDSEFVDIGDCMEVILPDQVPSLHHVCGEVTLGITALNYYGNESDMVRLPLISILPLKEFREDCYGRG